MDARLTIACVFKPGKGFFAEYVYRLKRAVESHCKVPFDFVCLSSVEVPGVKRIPLTNGWMGWWNKLELFKHKFPGRVAYFDLDTIIWDDITDIVTKPLKFAALAPFKDHTDVPIMDEDSMGSGVMTWDGTHDWSRIPSAFHPSRMREYETKRRWGDQGFIQDHLGMPFERLQQHFPNRILRFKSDLRNPDKSLKPVPRGTSIVCFSGEPRPHKYNWELPRGD